MKYCVEFKYFGELHHPYNNANWHIWHNIGCHDSPALILIKIIEDNAAISFVKIDKNLYKFINSSGSIYHFRIRFEEEEYASYNYYFIDWIPIGEEITIEKLNDPFKLNNPIDWNLGLLK